MKYLVIDFEAFDPYISRGLGAGWAIAMNAKKSDFKALCFGYRSQDGKYGVMDVATELSAIQSLVEEHGVIIAHNVMYDAGILGYLGISVKEKILIDTVILSNLFRNNVMNHSLEFLAKTYLKIEKTQGSLGEVAFEKGIYPLTKAEQKKFDKEGANFVRKKPLLNKLTTWAYANMDLLYEHAPKTVGEYCIQDVKICWELFNKFKGLEQDLDKRILYSNCLKALMKMRVKGIRVDLEGARTISKELVPQIAKAYQKCYDIAGEEFNLSSIKDVPRILDKLHIKYPKTAKGNPSVVSDWLEEQNHPICAAISDARKLHKLHNDFVLKILDMQQYTLGVSEEEAHVTKYGRIHPEIILFGASRTGRFSSRNPNIQQIPKHDKEKAKLVRSIFVPEDGEIWLKGDFSNQEGRIQLHFANLINCKGVKPLVEAYQKNPKLDMHQTVADLAGITRDQAKTITHGIGFGMGALKLCEGLKVSELEGKEILEKFHTTIPYVKDFMGKCINAMNSKNYIVTLGGRKLFNDTFSKNGVEETLSYKAISKLIQGSACDQTIEALNLCYLADLPVLCIVHDEFNLSVQANSDFNQITDIMKNAIKLDVPVEVDITHGNSWAEATFPDKE